MLTIAASRLVAVVALVVGGLLVPAAAATADPVKICDDEGNCIIDITDPGNGGGGPVIDPIGNPPGGGGGGWVRPPSPGPGWFWCGPPASAWLPPGSPGCAIAPPGTPGDPAAPVVDPAALAQQAVAMLQLTAPEIGIVPKMGAGRMGAVGAPVWMWTPEAQWAPLTATATAGGLQVTATAELEYIDWDMGDGRTVRCDTPGEEYQRGYGLAMSPECGHRYEHTSINEPNMEYVVEATAHYAVTWAGATAGSQAVPMTSTTPLRIGEIQTVVVDG